MQLGTNEPLRILIVEDDIVDRKLLERLLSRSSLPVSEVKSEAYLDAALQVLAGDSFDIVLLDLGLPDSNGIESITKVQSIAPHVPIIVMSGLDDQNTAILAVQKGVQDYLIKGQVDSNLLMRSVRYAIERKKTEHELQSAEQRYRTIFENSAVAIMMVDGQERLVSWNKFTEKLLSMTEADLHHCPVKSLYPENEWERIRAHNVRQKGMQHHLETKMVKKNGDIIDVDVSLSVLKDAGGNITGSIGVIRDVTERKIFEEALRRSEQRFRQVVDNAQEWIWEVDADGTYTYSSPMIEKILGYRTDEILGKKHFYDLFHPEDREQLKQLSFANFAKKNAFYEFKNRNIHKDGHEVWLSTSGVPILDENQNLLGYRGVDIDITERKRITEILDRKQKNLEAIFDAAPIGMLLIDENLTVKRANDAVRRLVQKDFSDIVNVLPGSALGCFNIAYNETECGQTPACAKCLLRKTARLVVDAQESVHGLEFQPTLIVNDRQIRPWFSLSAEPVVIDGQKHAVIAINDVTDRKKAEEGLKETMEMKSQFISTVSHELRTPLTSMKEAVVIVLDEVAGKINKDQRHFLDVAKRNIDRLARLINDVLDFQKLGSGKMELNMQQHDIAKVVEDAYNTMVPYAKKNKVHLALKLQDRLPKATFDSDRIIQVLTNLMSNAIKFTPEKGRISVIVKQQDEQFLISVADTGMGIPEDALPKIFDRFYRVNRPGKEIKGTGLGLAIVYKIVQAHSGRIEVESDMGKGTTFTVYLPLTLEPKTKPSPEAADSILEETLQGK
jgi:PAS domain S-box-containing protein